MNRIGAFAHTIKGWWKHDPKGTPVKILRGAWNLFMFSFREKATEIVSDLRRNDCIDCSIRDPIHDTCGDMVNGDTYVHGITGKRLALGCGCSIDLKTQIAEANCWLYDKHQGGGWTRNLNGDEH